MATAPSALSEAPAHSGGSASDLASWISSDMAAGSSSELQTGDEGNASELPVDSPDGDSQSEETVTEEALEGQPQEQTQDKDVDEKPNVPKLTDPAWERAKGYRRWSKELGLGLGLISSAEETLDPAALPSVGEVVSWREDAANFAAAEHDFASAVPEKADNFINSWNSAHPQGMVTMASRLPDILAKSNQQAYTQMAMPVINRYLNGFVNRIVEQMGQTQDQAQQERLYQMAQTINHDATGQWLDPSTFKRNGADPLAQREQQIAQREQADQQRQQNENSRLWNGFQQEVIGTRNQEVTAAIDKGLETVKKTLTPFVYEALRDKAIAETTKAVEADRYLMQGYNMALERTRASGSYRNQQAATDAKAALVKQYIAAAQRVINTRLPKWTSDAGVQAKASSDKRHTQLQQASSQKNVGGNGQPRQQSIVPQTANGMLPRNPGESMAQWQTRQIMHDMA